MFGWRLLQRVSFPSSLNVWPAEDKHQRERCYACDRDDGFGGWREVIHVPLPGTLREVRVVPH